MKKLVALMFAACVTCAFAEQATITVENGSKSSKVAYSSWTPISIGIVTPVALPWGFDWDIRGAQFGLYCRADNVAGAQLGVINVADSVHGVQAGLLNVTDRMIGIQFGIINVITTNDVPALPILNCYF